MTALLNMLADIEHRQWAEWAAEYMDATARERTFLMTMIAQDYKAIGPTQQIYYVPYAKQAIHAFMAAGWPIRNDGVAMSKMMELDHIQRQAWLTYQDKVQDQANIVRWTRQINTAYDDLSEKEKDSDREWAQKAIDAMEALCSRS